MRIFLIMILSGFLISCIQVNHGAEGSGSFDTTLINSNSSFYVTTRDIGNDLLLLTSISGGKTVLADTLEAASALAYIKYPDFNKDGNADILLDYYGNNSSYQLYLFDPVTGKFIEIERYVSFPDAIQLKSNSRYYYSYSATGCADMNWESDLFEIRNFKIVQLGHIAGHGCNNNPKIEPPVLKFYNIENGDQHKSKLLDTLPYPEYISDNSKKWDFLKTYWNDNYTKFE